MSRINKLLVANRGEIAVRIFRTCRDLGIETVAVYSDADRSALHVRIADEAYRIGPARASESYLDREKLIACAQSCGADAIHPGYGFLSENADFAHECREAGLIFVGPSAGAIRAMGDKTRARRLMVEAGVSMAPGTTEAVGDLEEVNRVAREIGFPILVKAAAGGGGKGMRIVHERNKLEPAFDAARREAEAAFGDGRVYIEKFLEHPRHIEIQILADEHDHVLYLMERECSIQRRHQKVIEECPSAVLDSEMRRNMGEAAVRAARACGYSNAGTVEFLLNESGDFYFMEMNTRLQVEHPVTEAVLGLDLVAYQIRIAEGQILDFEQKDVVPRGHAIECRVYAEDPDNNFLPDSGVLWRHRAPSGPGIRVDAGVEEGDVIEVHYDPMISKVIALGSTRSQAIDRMIRALDEYEVVGVRTTIPFCARVLSTAAFREGRLSTRFIEEHGVEILKGSFDDEWSQVAAVAAALAHRNRHTVTKIESSTDGWSSWANRRRRKRRR